MGENAANELADVGHGRRKLRLDEFFSKGAVRRLSVSTERGRNSADRSTDTLATIARVVTNLRPFLMAKYCERSAIREQQQPGGLTVRNKLKG
jgi:hypothetical protein